MKNAHLRSFKVQLLLLDINEIWIFSSDIKFDENPSSGSRVVPYGRTDRHEADSRFSQLCQDALKLKQTAVNSHYNNWERSARPAMWYSHMLRFWLSALPQKEWDYSPEIGGAKTWVISYLHRFESIELAQSLILMTFLEYGEPTKGVTVHCRKTHGRVGRSKGSTHS